LAALIERIESAKTDSVELDRLIAEYMPFIKRTISDAGSMGMEYDDRLSIAMLTFMNCVKQYDIERGHFVAFCATCIRNRLIDESRKQMRYKGRILPLFPAEEDSVSETAEERASLAAYDLEKERESLSDEIDVFSRQLAEYGISFRDLPRICPKQKQSRKQCADLGRFVASDKKMLENLIKNNRLAQSELAKNFGLSEKTIEKRRKYIVTIVILLVGDYPLIKAFLPLYEELKS